MLATADFRDTRAPSGARFALRLQSAGDGQRDPVPRRRFLPELLPTATGQPVVLRAAVVLRQLPRGREPAGLFEPMQRRKQRARLNGKRAAGDLLDPAG